MVTSPRTLLRIVRQEHDALVTTPRVVGVDDWALRKGRTYGTVLVDLEYHRPIDLLLGRDAETLLNWLQAHPGVAVIARDRSTEYIRGATAGAPAAQQVADRWHLLQNLRQVVERCLNRLRAELQILPLLTTSSHPKLCSQVPLRAGPFRRSAPEREAGAASHARWLAVYEQVQRLHHEGHNNLPIARLLQLDRKRVRKYISLAALPPRAKQRARKSILDAYLPYLLARRQEGCTNGMQLWREICEQGYGGTYGQVARWMRQQDAQNTKTNTTLSEDTASSVFAVPSPSASVVDLPSHKSLAWLLMAEDEKVQALDALLLHSIRQHPVLEQIYQLAQQFKSMLNNLQPSALDPWLAACANSQIADLQTFAVGLSQDYAAVRAALETKWSNGQTEGQVNRLKPLNRQMYGRAKLDLLRLRLLHPV